MKEESLIVQGTIKQQVSGHQFRVKLDRYEKVILCQRAGKMSKYSISISIGDKVLIAMSPYSMELGRIVRRM